MNGVLTELGSRGNEPETLLDETVILRLKLMQRDTRSISELWRDPTGLIHHQEEKLNTCCLSLGKAEPTVRPGVWGSPWHPGTGGV